MKKQDFRIFPSKSKGQNMWLPYWVHTQDTEHVFQLLMEHWIPLSVVRRLSENGVNVIQFSGFLGRIHDIGKLTQRFQKQMKKSLPTVVDYLKELGYPLTEDSDGIGDSQFRHCYLGEAILSKLGVNASVACVVGAHHGSPAKTDHVANYVDWQEGTSVFWNDREESWMDLWNDTLQDALQASGYQNVEELPVLSEPEQMLWSGYLQVADWIASNTKFFPMIPVFHGELNGSYEDRIQNGWQQLNFPVRLFTPDMHTNVDFSEQFGFLPNVVQQEFLNIVNSVKNPGLFILEAPMGCGKTEAALAGAEHMMYENQVGGLFFGMPTQATANGLMPRMKGWAEHLSNSDLHSFRLYHGKAAYQKEYKDLMKSSVDMDLVDASGLYVHPWMEGNKQSMLSDFVLGTVDQCLLAGLKKEHVMMRQSGLAGKVVVIDECHAYDTYMREFLKTALYWLGLFHTPVILLSATLPSKYRKEYVYSYVSAYNPVIREKDCETPASVTGYPLVTYTEQDQIFYHVISAQTLMHRQVRVQSIKPTECIDVLTDKLSDGGCAAVILNTVKASQEMYEQLKAAGFEHVLLIHSRFTAADRAELEERVLTLTGKASGKAERDGVILVGTQVLEQSLDYDVDLMLSQLCPMDLLLQRMGRLHRHFEHDAIRPMGLKEPQFYVIDNPDEELPEPKKAESTPYKTLAEYPYAKWLLLQTRKYLPDQVRLPEDIPELVELVYRSDEDSKEYAVYRSKEGEAAAKAKAACLPRHLGLDDATLHGYLSLGQKSKADVILQVRDSGDFYDVYVLWNDGKKIVLGNEIIMPDQNLSEMEFENLLGSAISLPSWFIAGDLQKTYANRSTFQEKNENYDHDFQTWRKKYPLLQNAYFLVLNKKDKKFAKLYTSESGLLP